MLRIIFKANGRLIYRNLRKVVRFGLRLSLKGKVLAGAYIARLDDEEFLLIAEQMPPGSLLDMLEENVVADEVEFSDESENWEYFSLKIDDPDSFVGKLGSAPEAIEIF